MHLSMNVLWKWHFPFADGNMALSQRKCLDNPSSFRYIYEEYNFMEHWKFIKDFVKSAYLNKLENQHKTWTLHNISKTYVEHLLQRDNGKSKCLKFGIYMVCREQGNQSKDCYISLVKINDLNGCNRSKRMYPDVDSVKWFVKILVSSFVHLEKFSKEDEPSTSALNITHRQRDRNFEGTSSVAQVFSYPKINGVSRELTLSKKSSKCLVSRLVENNLLQLGNKITYYQKKEIDL